MSNVPMFITMKENVTQCIVAHWCRSMARGNKVDHALSTLVIAVHEISALWVLVLYPPGWIVIMSRQSENKPMSVGTVLHTLDYWGKFLWLQQGRWEYILLNSASEWGQVKKDIAVHWLHKTQQTSSIPCQNHKTERFPQWTTALTLSMSNTH